MSVFADGAPQILAMEACVRDQQFHAEKGGSRFRFVSQHPQAAKRRTAPAIIDFAL
jgi:hypothetical protein